MGRAEGSSCCRASAWAVWGGCWTILALDGALWMGAPIRVTRQEARRMRLGEGGAVDSAGWGECFT